MKLLITGGAGYVGSHMVKYAQEAGHEIVVLDNFSTGHEWAITNCEILRVSLLDRDRLLQLLKGRYFDGVIHLAGKTLVGESVKKPDLYYQNNVVGTLNLIQTLLKNEVNNIVFSSTAAVFGNPKSKKISESHPKNPINPYGRSKLIIENMLEDICLTGALNVTSLRYFNAAGAHETGQIGEMHHPETHLIPNILNVALLGKGNVRVFGNDYPTPDGTCIRDYVHVNDLAQAHLLGLEYMSKNTGFKAFNLGNGDGFSVIEVIESCEKVANVTIPFQIDERRSGDPAILVSDSKLAFEKLNWNPQYRDISSIVESAWSWHKGKGR